MIRGLLRMIGGAIRPIWTFVRLPLQLFVTVLILAALIAGGWSWYWGDPDRPPPVPVRPTLSVAVDEVCGQVPEAVPRPKRAMRPLLVLPLVGDRELLLTGNLRDAFSEQSWYRVVDKGGLDRFVDQLFEVAGMPREPVADPATAIKLAQAASAEVVLIGRVDQLEPLEESVNVAVHVRMFEVESGELLFEEAFSNAKPEEVAESPAATGGFSLGLSVVLGLAAFALIWPPITIPVMRRVLRMESNGAALLAIVLITAVPVAAASPLVLGGEVGVLGIALFVVIALLVGLWCMVVMSWVADSEG